jgi:hypothetical protein
MTAIDSKAARRQIANEFKERKVAQGIFAVRCAPTGEIWVGSSRNLDAAKNSNWFQLRAGVGRSISLQKAWTLQGEDAFAFEVVEKFDDDLPALLLDQTLREKKQQHGAALTAQLL